MIYFYISLGLFLYACLGTMLYGFSDNLRGAGLTTREKSWGCFFWPISLVLFIVVIIFMGFWKLGEWFADRVNR